MTSANSKLSLVFDHGFTRHGQSEYVSEIDRTIHTDTIEGFISIIKRGMKGIFNIADIINLNSCLAEFDFRYNNRVALDVNDTDRVDNLLRSLRR